MVEFKRGVDGVESSGAEHNSSVLKPYKVGVGVAEGKTRSEGLFPVLLCMPTLYARVHTVGETAEASDRMFRDGELRNIGEMGRGKNDVIPVEVSPATDHPDNSGEL